MSIILCVALLGIVAIAVMGLLGRRGADHSTLAEWTVGGRSFGTATTWFLQAGEAFTTFTFLAVAGVAFGAGALATYAIPYIPLAFAGLYFMGPRLWRLGQSRGYLTQADFFADRYRCPLMGKVVALTGVIFLLPYLQLQITGLGLIVQLVTGSASSGRLSMVVATVLTVAFVLWSGIRGLANTAYLKDALMILTMVVLIVAIPVHYAGGIGHLFSVIESRHPQMLTVGEGPMGRTWWLTGVLISAIGAGLMTTPHSWPPLLAARSPRVLRRNYAWLPVYQVVIILPVVIGFTGALTDLGPESSNGILLTLAHGALPGWLTGVVAVAAASAAMVPAASMCIGISSLVAHNLVPGLGERGRLRVNHLAVVASAGSALYLGLERPDLLANLLLLTFSGLSQLAPALVAALGDRRLLQRVPALAGMVVGVALVAWLTLGKVDLHGVNAGIVALAVNVAVAVVGEAIARMLGHRPIDERPARLVDDSALRLGVSAR